MLADPVGRVSRTAKARLDRGVRPDAALQVVFLSAAPFAVLGFLVVIFLREHALSTRQGRSC
jgi:hypothetical protein